MKIKKIALIGAGAIGSFFIRGLYGKPEIDFCVVAYGGRATRLKRDGLVINGQQVFPNVRAPQEAAGADLLIVAVKYSALKTALEDIKTVIGRRTIVMTVLNGVDSEEIAGQAIGQEHVIPSFMKTPVQRNGNTITFDPQIGIGVLFGERDGQISERVMALSDLFSETGVHFSIRKNIMQDMWYKYALNISKNITQAVISCGFGAFTDSPHVAYICSKMREEVVAVAKAKGIDVSDENNPATKSSPVSPDSRFSTLQDLDAKRPTEIDMFSGALIRMGRELNVPTPFNDFAYHAVKALEEKNLGIIS